MTNRSAAEIHIGGKIRHSGPRPFARPSPNPGLRWSGAAAGAN